MTRVIFVFNAPYYKEQPPEGIRIPVFLNGSRFENMNWETIKSTEIKRRTSIHEAVRDEIVGCGSAEMAHTIGNDVTHRSYLSLPRKLHFDLVERLTKDIESTARATAPKLISEGVAAQQESRSISLNENKKKLAIANSQVNLAKSPIQYDLIRIILKSNEPYREWFFDEIAEVADPEDINQTKFSNAAYQLKDAIIIKCDVRDFFEILNTKSCKINEKYRLNST
jgi:hypothetical protein